MKKEKWGCDDLCLNDFELDLMKTEGLIIDEMRMVSLEDALTWLIINEVESWIK